MTISEFAISKIGCGYVYGATGWVCTPEHRQQQAQQYPEQANNCLVIAAKWDGKQCFDCAQLTRFAAKEEGIALPSGATSQWNAAVWAEKGKVPMCTDKWAMDNLDNGTLLYRQSKDNPSRMTHTGIYIGGGEVVEAKGAAYGVVKTRFTQGNWTHYGVLKGKAQQQPTTPTEKPTGTTSTPTNALVTAPTGSTVNLRDKPNGKILKRVPIGSSVFADTTESWTKVTFEGTTGYMMSDFVVKGNG